LTLRAGENCLFYPAETPQVDLSPFRNLKPFPGEYFAVMDPPRKKTRGGVLLDARGDGWSNEAIDTEDQLQQAYDEASSRALVAIERSKQDPRSFKLKTRAMMLAEIAMSAYEKLVKADKAQDAESPGAALETRADAYTVVASGDGVPFTPGDRVMLAPYAARRFKNLFGVPDVVMVGREDPWQDITILLWDPIQERWAPVDNWIAVQFDVKARDVLTTHRKFLNSGVVRDAGPWAQSKEGDRVALHRDRTVLRPDDTKWFASKWGPYDGQGVMFVREVDSDGVRRVLGRFEEASV